MKIPVLTYSLSGKGWATLQVCNKNEQHTFIVSYLHDSLKELSEATLQLMDKKEKALVSFMDEPGELQLEMVKHKETGMIRITGRGYENTFGSFNNESFSILFSFEVRLFSFAKAVFLVMDAIYSEGGMKGYLEKWGMHDFPIENYKLLQKVYGRYIQY